MKRVFAAMVFVAGALAWLLPLTVIAGSQSAFAQGTATSPVERHVFFGDLHLHTTMSFDAWTMGTKVTPDQAYKFAKGLTVMVPAAQATKEEGYAGQQDVPAKRAWPLDFTAVTDHSELMGTLHQLDDPNKTFANSELGKKIIANANVALKLMGHWTDKVVSPPEMNTPAAMKSAWDLEVKAANDNYEPGKFTTLVAYEWTSMNQGRNLHRNVFFDSDHAPQPFTSADSNRPEDLWSFLASVRAQGIDVISIPHNGNASSGLMYDWNDSDGKSIDEAYAQQRALNEPLTEIVQNKGQSDTHPEISPNDEFANFEIFDRLIGQPGVKSSPHGSYIREAFGRGLVIQSLVGVNPYKYGVVGATDFHSGLTTSDENAFAGGAFGFDPNTMAPNPRAAARILGVGEPDPAKRKFNLDHSSGGLTGVWAEANTRNSIFAALKRKETFATSGTRIRVRLFGGWDFDPKLTVAKDWAATAYASGVPMGSDLPARPAVANAPSFAVWAMKDPDGANLDRIQVIKVWLEGSDYKEKIFDVALSDGRKVDPKSGKAAAVGNTVDLTSGAYRNGIGSTELRTVWRDPEFDAAKPAVYYLRVLEIPTPRWSTILAIRNKLPISTDAPATIQERAWSSPIWYTPTKS